MTTVRTITYGALILLLLAVTPAESQAWRGGCCGCRGRFGIGIGIGIPIGGPWYGYGYYPYYGPPVVVAPQPVQVVQPVYAAPAPVTCGAVPPPPAPPALEQAPMPAPVPLQPTSMNCSPYQGEIDRNLRLLADPSDRTRLNAAVQLGRLRAAGAVDSLAATLATDKSAAVREGAARALGMIGSAHALPDLHRATQADSDPSVRHTAQFSIDVIQSRQN